MDWLQDQLNTTSKVLVLLNGELIHYYVCTLISSCELTSNGSMPCNKELYICVFLLAYPGGQSLAFLVVLQLWLLRKLHGDLLVMLPFLRYGYFQKAKFWFVAVKCLVAKVEQRTLSPLSLNPYFFKVDQPVSSYSVCISFVKWKAVLHFVNILNLKIFAVPFSLLLMECYVSRKTNLNLVNIGA